MKKMISVILSVILAFTMISCSNNEDGSFDATHTENKTEENISTSEITPDSYSTFVLDINSLDTYVAFKVPEKWGIKKRNTTENEHTQFLALDECFIEVYDILDDNDNNCGAIGVASYIENVDAEDKLIAVYGSIALPNMYKFALNEESYSIVKIGETGETAITKVYHSPSFSHNNSGLGDAVYGDGILSYNKECLAFVAVEYKEGLFNDDALIALAESIEIDWITGM